MALMSRKHCKHVSIKYLLSSFCFFVPIADFFFGVGRFRKLQYAKKLQIVQVLSTKLQFFLTTNAKIRVVFLTEYELITYCSASTCLQKCKKKHTHCRLLCASLQICMYIVQRCGNYPFAKARYSQRKHAQNFSCFLFHLKSRYLLVCFSYDTRKWQ